MNKKKIWSILGILIPVLIGITLLVITLGIGGSSGTGTDSSLMSIGTFFVIFVLPGIIAHQKKEGTNEK